MKINFPPIQNLILVTFENLSTPFWPYRTKQGKVKPHDILWHRMTSPMLICHYCNMTFYGQGRLGRMRCTLKEATGNDQRLELRISTNFPNPQLFGIPFWRTNLTRRVFTRAPVDRQNFQKLSQRSQLCGILEFTLCQRNGKVWWMIEHVHFHCQLSDQSELWQELVQSYHRTTTVHVIAKGQRVGSPNILWLFCTER